MEILGNDSYQRVFLVFRTPVAVSKDGKLSTPVDPSLKDPKPFAEFQSPLPPAGWMKPEFNAAGWDRVRAPVEVGPGGSTGGKHVARHTATANSLILLRSQFVVRDPSQVRDLALTLQYVGGVAVYLNGQELTRAHLPAGELKPETLAEGYPDDLYCEPGGLFLQDIVKGQAGFERRFRRLERVPVPEKLLRPGVNTLALEIHRAPVNEAAIEARRTVLPGGMNVIPGIWAYAGLRALSLAAAAGSAVEPNVARPAGIQVWNCAPSDTITVFDYGEGGTPQPVAVTSPRNGVFSGRLVVSADQPIRGLKVAVTDLAATTGGNKLPATAVSVRCAEAATPAKCWAPAHRFDALAGAIPAEIPLVKAAAPRERYPHNTGKYIDDGPIVITRRSPSAGAVAPLWFTVRVPAAAPAGRYEGTITIAAEGLPPVTVPLQVTVPAWTLPAPKAFRVQHFAYFSEDAVAKHYGAEMWSDRHFALLAKSWELMAEVNARQAIANLCINFYGGNKGAIDCSNEQSLIRWVRQADGTYRHDYALFDKYLDSVAKTIGKPTLLRLNCWGESVSKDGALIPGGPGEAGKVSPLAVSLLDPATGKLSTLTPPVSGTPEHLAFWKPVLDEVRRKIEARGWWDVTAMGWNSYCYPPIPPVVGNLHKIWPDGVWSYTAHNGTMGARFPTLDKAVQMPVRYSDCVWSRGWPTARGYRALLQPRPSVWCYTFRTDMRDWSELALLRSIPEEEILCGHDGVSDFGADLFPLAADRGRFRCLGNGRGTGGPDDSTRALLAPGPDGAVATERFEMLREGTELAETILFLQRTLDAKMLSGEIEQRANRLLDERDEAFLKRWESGRSDRDARLLALAGEVAAASGK
jgi:hypothetical protein